MGICYCCCCHKCSNTCIEIFELLFSLFSAVALSVGLGTIDWKNTSLVGMILYAVMLGLSVVNIIFFVIIYQYRSSKTIFDKRNKAGLVLAGFGMAFTIIILLSSIVAESFIIEENYKADHPCWNFNYKTGKVNSRNLADANLEDLNILCPLLGNSQASIEKIKDKEKIINYVCCSIVQFFSLLGIFLWYNDARRIKYFIKNIEIESEGGGILYGAFGGYLGKYYGNGLYLGRDNKFYNKDRDEVDITKANKKNKSNKKGKKKKNGSVDGIDTFNIKQSQTPFDATYEENNEDVINTNSKNDFKKSGNKVKKRRNDNQDDIIEVADL